MKHVSQPLIHVIFSCLVVAALPLCGEETSTIKGRIVSDHANVEVVWLGVFVGSVEQETEAWKWTSVATKQFSLEIPNSNKELTLVALQKNSVPITTRITQELRDTEITLEFERGQVFNGTVLSTDEIPVSDAVLTVERPDGPSLSIPSEAQIEWTTEMDGTFSIGGLVESSYDVHVELTHAPKESFVIRVKDGEDNQQDLVLADAYHVKGRVIDHVGGGVAGATVSTYLDPILWKDPSGNIVLGAEMAEAIKIHGSVWGHPSNDLRTSSGSTGAFQFGPFAYGQGLEMSASHKNGGSTNEIKVFSGNHEITLILSKTVEVIGTVVDAETGAPIEQFTLEIHGRANSEFPHSESGGRISAQVDSATWALVIQAPNYIPYFMMDLKLDSQEQFDIGVVELERGVQVTGQVYDLQSREPVKWALIESWGSVLEEGLPPSRNSFISRQMRGKTSTRSDSEGNFSIGPLPADESILYVEAHNYMSEKIVVDRPAEKLDIGLQAVDFQNTRIVARIRTANGEPIEGRVEVSHEEETSFRPYSRFPGDDHSWNIVVYPGTYKVWAVSDRGRSKVVDIVATDGNTQEVVLIVDPFGRLRGTISGLKSGEDPFVSVFSGNDLVQATAVVLNGEFDLEGIGAGSFTVRIETSMNRQIERSFSLSKAVGEAFVDIAFEGDSRLYGKVLSSVDRDSKIRAIGKEKGSISGWGDLLDDGSFEIRGLSDGEYWIEVSDDREFESRSSDGASPPVREEAVVVGDTEITVDLASP